MNLEPSRHLRLKISITKHPGCLGSNGEIEHWVVCVYEVKIGSNHWPYEVTGELAWIDVPERWDDFTRIPAHKKVIPGVKVDTQPYPSLVQASKRARERALCLSGYMLPGPWLVEEAFKASSSAQNSCKGVSENSTPIIGSSG